MPGQLIDNVEVKYSRRQCKQRLKQPVWENTNWTSGGATVCSQKTRTNDGPSMVKNESTSSWVYMANCFTCQTFSCYMLYKKT